MLLKNTNKQKVDQLSWEQNDQLLAFSPVFWRKLLFNCKVFIKICKDKYAKVKLTSWYPSKDPPQTLLVCKALPLLNSACSVPNPYESCVLTYLSFLFQGHLWSTHHFLFCFPIGIDCTLLLIASHPRSPLFIEEWFPIHSNPPFSSQTLFPYTNVPIFLLPNVSWFSCVPHIKIHHTPSQVPRALCPHSQPRWVPWFSQFHGRCNFYQCLNVLLSPIALAASSPSLLFFEILFSSLKDIPFRASAYKNLLGRWLEPRWEHCFAARY